MGKFYKGILGGFSGKVGPVVGLNWKGVDIMRSLPKKSGRVPSQAQLAVRAKFRLVIQFLNPVRALLSKYFGQEQGVQSRWNLATSFHINEAVIGTFPAFGIDYTKVIFSRGELTGLQSAVGTPQPGAGIAISWEDNSGQGFARADDGLLVVAYNESRGLFETREMAAVRSSGTYTLELPAAWTGEQVQCWTAFTSADGKKCSTSVFMGAVTLV